MLLKTPQIDWGRKLSDFNLVSLKFWCQNYFVQIRKRQKHVASSYKGFSNDFDDFDELVRLWLFEKLDLGHLFPLLDSCGRFDQVILVVPRNHFQALGSEKKLLDSSVRQDDFDLNLEKGELGQSRDQIGGRFVKKRTEDILWQKLVNNHPQSPHLPEGVKDRVEGPPVHPGVHVQGLHVGTAALDVVHQLRFEKCDWKRIEEETRLVLPADRVWLLWQWIWHSV